MDAIFEAVSGSDANREYKDSVFTLLCGTKKFAIEFSNAFLGTNYGPETEVAFTTLKNVLSKGRINDLSFVLDGKLVVLIEHQSTVNENMPLRMLLYIALIYELWTKDMNLYSRKRFTIPEPKFIVLENCEDDTAPDKRELRLSDMFAKHGIGAENLPPCLDLVVTVYNINKGRNKDLVGRSPTLGGYGTFIYMIRENRKTMSPEEAIKKAVIDSINQNVLKEFLSNRKREVVGMLLQEWKLDEALEVTKKEAWEEGREEGREEGMERGMEKGSYERALNIARNLLNSGMGVDDAAKLTGLTVEDILRL